MKCLCLQMPKKNAMLGFGGICQNSWMFAQWDKSFIVQQDPSIEYLELLGIVATAVNWFHRYVSLRLRVQNAVSTQPCAGKL